MLKKSEIIRLKQVEHIKAEKAILSRITHPFIVKSVRDISQDERYLYLTMEYVLGGELFSQLRKVGRFSNETAKSVHNNKRRALYLSPSKSRF